MSARATAREEKSAFLSEREVRALVTGRGVELPRQFVVPVSVDLHDGAATACKHLDGERVVLKAMAPGLAHKTDVGGVAVVDRTPEGLAVGMLEMGRRLAGSGLEGFTINELIPYDRGIGGEMLLSIRRTPDFGPVVSLGLGGLAAEVLASALEPHERLIMLAAGVTTPDQIERILDEKRLVPLMTGEYRGQKGRMSRADLRALLDRALEFALQRMPADIIELEINPLIATEGRLIALDLLARRGSVPTPAPARPLDRIGNLLRPRTVAVAGVSAKMNPGRVIVKNLLHWGFAPENIKIVKPGADVIDGCACVGSIGELPEPVDLLVLSIAAAQVPDAIDEVLSNRAAESVIVIPGGLGEHAGSEDLALRVRDALAASRDSDWGGPVVNGGNCLGIRSCPGGYDTMFLPPYKVAPRREPDAPLAVISQSGAFVVSKASKLAGLSPRYLLSVGNQIDLTVGDYLQHLADDSGVEVFAFYVEGFQPLDGQAWLQATARMTAEGRPVILYRAGRTVAGAQASASHTAAMAGDAALSHELARGAGALVADTLADFEDLVRLACTLRTRRVAGMRLGALSNAGFESVAFADALGGLQLAELSPATAASLGNLLEEQRLDRIVTIANPLDVNPMMNDAGFATTAGLLLEDTGVDVAVIGCVPLTGALQTLPAGDGYREDMDREDSVVSRLCDLWDGTSKAWVTVVDAGTIYDPMAARLEAHGIPVFRTADRAVRLLARYCSWRRQAEEPGSKRSGNSETR